MVKSGIGAAGGITYLLGGTSKQIEGAIRNISGNIVGTLCDGAKTGCAIKLSSASVSAIQCSLLALNGVIIPAGNGIVSETFKDTVKNIGLISKSMSRTEENLVKILKSHTKRI